MENKADKGHYRGSCNRTACQAPGATWYNFMTQRYYCPACGMLINDDNHPSSYEKMSGHPICVKRPDYDRFEVKETESFDGQKRVHLAVFELREADNELHTYDTTPGPHFKRPMFQFKHQAREKMPFPDNARTALELFVQLSYKSIQPKTPIVFLGYVNEQLERIPPLDE